MLRFSISYRAKKVIIKLFLSNIPDGNIISRNVSFLGDSVKCGCGRRMRTADNYKIRKIRKDRSFSSFNLRTIACNLYPCGLVLIQKWQVPKHLDLKGRLMSETLCKTNLGLRVLKRRPLVTLLMPCYLPKFLVALKDER